MLKLNDFYDLLYEKENTMTQQGLNEPQYFESEKYYTKGLGIDFPMIMSYKDTENPNFETYYYFLNGHNDVVYFADSNFTEERVESYEYNPWGVLLTSANKNNLLYTAREFDFDINLQFNRMRYYSPNLGRFTSKDKLFSKNYFLYASNDPIIFYDPLGLLPPGIGRFFWVITLAPTEGSWCSQPACGCNCEYLPGSYLCFYTCMCGTDSQWRWCICCPTN